MKRTPLMVALVLLHTTAAASAVSALDLSRRIVNPVRTWQAPDLARFSDQWLHVKFVEDTGVVWRGDRFTDDTGVDLAPVARALAGAEILEVRLTFDQDRVAARSWKAIAEARTGVIAPDLSLWYSLRVGGGAPALARLINDLNACPAVEIAHPEPIAENASVDPPGAPRVQGALGAITPDFTAQQGYLYNPPVGLNAPAAWAYPGGDGAGARFIDVELCWTEDHEDFPFSRLFYVGGAPQDPTYETHGTAVLGEIIGQLNGFGVNGFAPGLAGYGVVAIPLNQWPAVAAYFQEAVDHLSAGDVWLIELQMYPAGRTATPMEWLQANYDVIWTSVWARGVICIEAGANGSQNLDDASWGGVFDRNVRDSGAIMVAAGTPSGLVAESYSNYGSRMDVHAWGSSIVTTGYGDLYNGGTLQTRYTATFSGTSGASPMVAGSALCLSGIARAAGVTLTPVQIRTVLHDTGTPYQGTRYIGPRPNLSAAAARVIQTAAVTPAPAPVAAGWAIECAPNPFTESVALRVDVPGAGAMRIAVFDAVGRRVRTLGDAGWGGSRVLAWDGRGEGRVPLASGTYFLRIEAPGFERSLKVQKVR